MPVWVTTVDPAVAIGKLKMTFTRRRAIRSLALVGSLIAIGPRPANAAPLVPLASADLDLAPSRLSGWSYGTDSGIATIANTPAAVESDVKVQSVRTPEPTIVTPATPNPSPAPTNEQQLAGRRVGIQAGHYRTEELSPPLKTQTGATGRGLREAQVTLPIAEETAKALRAAGAVVDVLPAGISKGYRADLVVAVHADGGPADRRGYFVDYSFRAATNALEQDIARRLTEAYRDLGIPNVFRGTENSRYYYGYYSVDGATPMVLIETGFLTNGEDQKVIIERAVDVGSRIATGVIACLAR